MATLSYTPSSPNYFNSNNASGGSAIYFGQKFKTRFTMSATAINDLLNGRSIKSAKLTVKLGSHVYNSSATVTVGCSESGAVGTVFPNKTISGHKMDAGQNTTCTLYPANKTISLTATNAVKYAVENYSGTWYLWMYDNGHGESGTVATTPRLSITVDDGSVYIYDGTKWRSAIPYVYTDGVWEATVAYRWNGSAWVALSAPVVSADPEIGEGPEIFTESHESTPNDGQGEE